MSNERSNQVALLKLFLVEKHADKRGNLAYGRALLIAARDLDDAKSFLATLHGNAFCTVHIYRPQELQWHEIGIAASDVMYGLVREGFLEFTYRIS